jgi:hypothetical protein
VREENTAPVEGRYHRRCKLDQLRCQIEDLASKIRDFKPETLGRNAEPLRNCQQTCILLALEQFVDLMEPLLEDRDEGPSAKAYYLAIGQGLVSIMKEISSDYQKHNSYGKDASSQGKSASTKSRLNALLNIFQQLSKKMKRDVGSPLR